MGTATREATERSEAVLAGVRSCTTRRTATTRVSWYRPLCPDMTTFAAIVVTRSHARGVVDLMILDPSRGPMPRWKVPFSREPRPGNLDRARGRRQRGHISLTSSDRSSAGTEPLPPTATQPRP